MPKGSGRRPLPTAVKRLRGNPGKRPLNIAEPLPAPGEPKMPAWLSPVAVEKWKTLVPQLLKMKTLSVVDGDALASLCTAHSHALDAERDLQKNGLTIEVPVVDRDGKLAGHEPRTNPALKHWNDATKIKKSLEVEFGLTPAARTRIRVEPSGQPEDPLDALLNRRHDTQKTTARVN